MEQSQPLYFDTAATTMVAPEVADCMLELLRSPSAFANPSSNHVDGQSAAHRVQSARSEIALEFGCESDEVIFTSGATEANNLALHGIALAHAQHGKHLVTSALEHKSVLECCAALQRQGFAITYLKPNADGWIEPASVRQALRPDTLLISLQQINNETGVMQPVAEIAEIAADAGVLLHVDAAQAAGKFKIDLNQTPIDLLSLSAHKFHGPKGIGCLIVRNRRQLRLQPLMFGGGQEFGLRPGTLPTHQIAGLNAALSLAAGRREPDLAHVRQLKAAFIQQLGSRLPLQVHGDLSRCSPYIVNFSIPGIASDALMNQLMPCLAISSGSACSSGTVEPSYVLRAMGVEGDALYGAVRVSFGRGHSMAEIDAAIQHIMAAVARMMELV